MQTNNDINELSVRKSNIELVDLPAGTFSMGSFTNEFEREDTEKLHKVTLDAFSMSKYCVTVE